MKFTNMIDAIKAIRSLPVTLELTTNDKGEKVVSAHTSIGLKDAKDLVEAIMEYGKNSVISLESHLRAENLRLTDELSDLNQRMGKIRNITYPSSSDYNDSANDNERF